MYALEISHEVLEDFSVKITVNGEVAVHQIYDPTTRKPFASKEAAQAWYDRSGFYLVGGQDEPASSETR